MSSRIWKVLSLFVIVTMVLGSVTMSVNAKDPTPEVDPCVALGNCTTGDNNGKGRPITGSENASCKAKGEVDPVCDEDEEEPKPEETPQPTSTLEPTPQPTSKVTEEPKVTVTVEATKDPTPINTVQPTEEPVQPSETPSPSEVPTQGFQPTATPHPNTERNTEEQPTAICTSLKCECERLVMEWVERVILPWIGSFWNRSLDQKDRELELKELELQLLERQIQLMESNQ